MITYLKAMLLSLYWTPQMIKTLWAHIHGRRFVFRDSPIEFLHFLALLHGESIESADETVRDYLRLAMEELKSRKVVGGA